MARKPKADEGPHVVKVGSVSIRVAPWRHSSGRIYWRGTYLDSNHVRRDITRADRAGAIAEAGRIARQIHNGITDLTELPPEKIRMVRAFLDLSPTWADLERWGSERRGGDLTVADAITQFHAFKKAEKSGEETKHLKLTKSDLEKMADFVGPETRLGRVKSAALGEWLVSLEVEAKRTKDYRAACVALWRWARRQELIVVAGELTEPEKLPVPDVKKKDSVEILSADELAFLFTVVRPGYGRWLCLAAFSGLRNGEIRQHGKEPMDCSMIKLDRRLIDLPASLSKNRKRKLLPISDTLAAWLKFFGVPKSGPVVPEPPYNEETALLGAALAEKFGRDGWPANCLRHSFGSHMVAKTKDIPAVALEMDNSVKVIKDHYLEARTEEEAAAYFSVLPPNSGGAES